MSVPDTNTFALSDVVTEINPSMSPKSLGQCFSEAIEYLFWLDYIGNKDRLSNFRNYGNYYLHLTDMGVSNYSGEDILYRIYDPSVEQKPGSNLNRWDGHAINNTSTLIFNTTLRLIERTTSTIVDDYGALNTNIAQSVGDVPVLMKRDGNDYYEISCIIDPGQYRLEYLGDIFWTSVYPPYRYGLMYRDITVKRYVDLDFYSVYKEKGIQTTTFHQYNGELVEHIEDTGITVTTFIQNSGGVVDISIHDNGNIEEVLTCIIRTVNVTLREQKVFTVYHRGAPENYLSCIEIYPYNTVADSNNTHDWIVKNNSTNMSYSGTLYWQIKQGATEGTAFYIDGGLNTITDLASLQTIAKANTWYCDSSNGAYAYFYARFSTSDPWTLIDTQAS